MRGAPIPPAEYDGEHLDTDDKLREAGWAAGLDVWEQVGKGYSEWYLGLNERAEGDTLGNAQLWSLRKAIRRELVEELVAAEVIYPESSAHRRADEIAGAP